MLELFANVKCRPISLC